MRPHKYSKKELQRAQKHVSRLKSWYWSLPMCILVTVFMALLSGLMYANNEPNTIIWILMSTTMSLWVIFIVQGFWLGKSRIIKNWEERQIKKRL